MGYDQGTYVGYDKDGSIVEFIGGSNARYLSSSEGTTLKMSEDEEEDEWEPNCIASSWNLIPEYERYL